MTFFPIICIHINLWMISWSRVLYFKTSIAMAALNVQNFYFYRTTFWPIIFFWLSFNHFLLFHFISFNFHFDFDSHHIVIVVQWKCKNITMFKYPIYLQCDFPPYQFHNFPDAVNLMVSLHSLKQRMRMKKKYKNKIIDQFNLHVIFCS